MNVEIKNLILKSITEFEEINLCLVYGSYARGCERKNSDIDIAIAANPAITSQRIFNIKIYLTSILDKNVDLIDLRRCSGLILKEALCNSTLILNKSPLLYAKLIKKMLFNQADMMPYYNEILKKRRREFIDNG